MKIVFVSNFFNHHQKYISEALLKYTDGNYWFIETEPMSDERKDMGWSIETQPSYVLQNYTSIENGKICEDYIEGADVVLIGSAPLSLVKNRLEHGKLTFLYTERIYKKGYQSYKLPVRLVTFFKRYGQYKNFYLLCASAYTSSDFAKTRTFIDKAYKWGYFPKTKKYDDIDKLLCKKKKFSILWVARLIELKHPEEAIYVAEKLKEEGYDFELNIIGTGELQGNLEKRIHENRLEDCVKMLGTMTPDEVRCHMEKSEIFLFTSDRNEGWGAVLNESMNSGCAVVAGHIIGSVPFLIKDGQNGLVYESGNADMLYEKVKYLLDNQEERERLGKGAYHTIENEWDAEIAASRLVHLSEELLLGSKSLELYQDGPCSKAKIVKENWFKKENKG